MDKKNLINKIMALKKEHNAVIVAHNYQVDDVQELADVTGDSFALSKYCASTKYDVVVFCGVHFMAESAKILSPDKTVLLPEIDAGCPMANMVTAETLRKAKKEHPKAAVVCYINSSAEVKAESDICCTSSNALKVVKSLEQEEVLFVPDKNLGHYISKQLPEKKFIFWDGFCVTHHRVTPEQVIKAREAQPDAILLVHPECRPEVVEMADFVGSTRQIIQYANSSPHKKFIIGTEMGIMYQLRTENPDKEFYLLAQSFVCPNMKKTSLNSVYEALRDMKYKIELDEDIRLKAKTALDRMLAIE
ncbi:MAG TPA: quinolinate synthase NadA [Clostridiaceae bacterium]|jgi:quinolinate synthase|nr:quinolinate synthase NadA [Clostridiaceae bacterium]